MKARCTLFYDVPVSLCKKRAEKRIEEEKLKPNQDIVDGCRYQNVRDLQMSAIQKFDIETKPKIMDLIESLWEEKVQAIRSEKELSI